MFNRNIKPDKFKDAETVIGASIKVKGNFIGQGNIVIEGTLEGSLKTDANMFVGEKAKVVANIDANDLIIYGDVRGNFHEQRGLASHRQIAARHGSQERGKLRLQAINEYVGP